MGDKEKTQQTVMGNEAVQFLQIICAVLVILHHLGEQGVPWLNFFITMGYYPVAFFFFCSGYGLAKSYQNKEHYLDTFWQNRMLKILLPYLTANVIYLTVKLILHDTEGLHSLKSFLFGGAVVKYSWYVIALVFGYVLFYAAFRIWGRKIIIAQSVVVLGIIAWVFLMCLMKGGEHRYVSSPCFALGCILGYWNGWEKIPSNICSNCVTGLLLGILMASFISGANVTSIAGVRICCEMLGSICFTLFLVWCTSRICSVGFWLKRWHKYNYHFYLYQGLWIILMKMLKSMPILYCITVIAGTMLTAVLVGLIDEKLISVMRSTLERWKNTRRKVKQYELPKRN